MTKRLIKISVVFLILIAIFIVATGFFKNEAVLLRDFELSKDGREITLHVDVAESMGYVRKAVVHQQQGGKLYVDFYGAFGGLNGSIGAQDTFTLPLDADTKIIGFARAENAYQTVLEKDASGTWAKVN